MNSSTTMENTEIPQRSRALRVILFVMFVLIVTLGLPELQQSQRLYYQFTEIHLAPPTASPNVGGRGCPTQWPLVRVDDIDSMPGVTTLCAEFNIDVEESGRKPLGLYVVGLMASEIYWDSRLLASNGRVGESIASEEPGRIDYTVHVPDLLTNAGRHTLTLRLSSHHVGYDTTGLIQALGLGPYREDSRRSTRYYLPAILLGGAFLVFSIQFGQLGRQHRRREYLAFLLCSAFVLMQLLAEIGRSLIDYTYDWHLARSALIWLAACGAGLSLNLLATHKTGVDRTLVAAGIVAAAIWSWSAQGFDAKTVGAILILTAPPTVLILRDSWKSGLNYRLALPVIWLAWAVSIIVNSTLFLDSLYYSLTATFLCFTYLFHGGEERLKERKLESGTDCADRIKVYQNGKELSIRTIDIRFLRAIGNYTEIHCNNGKSLLHHVRLGKVMELMPEHLVRVHRSYAVNKQQVKFLQSRSGSKYSVALGDEIEIPVSRAKVKELRKIL